MVRSRYSCSPAAVWRGTLRPMPNASRTARNAVPTIPAPDTGATLFQLLARAWFPGCSDYQLARYFGCSRQAIQHYRTGTRGVPPQLLERFPKLPAAKLQPSDSDRALFLASWRQRESKARNEKIAAGELSRLL